MNRTDLRRLSALRAKEARVLLDNGCYDGAYYLIGYAVECGLKACIAKRTQRYDFLDKRTVNESFTHNLEKLVQVIGLNGDLTIGSRRDPAFRINWGVAKDWDEQSRYSTWTRPESENLYRAVTDRRHGVLRWVKQHW
jgi:HEPN domain-containing protein